MNQNRPFSEHDDHPEFRGDRGGDCLSASDALFAMLDGQIIRGREGAWRAEVVSILAERNAIWVQVSPARCPSRSVLLRLPGHQHADEALHALRTWTDLPEEQRPTVIEVVPYAARM